MHGAVAANSDDDISTRHARLARQFGGVAGGRGDSSGFSPLLEGDDDAVVRVEETRLDGADDFLLLPVHHAAMLRDPKVQQATESFLKSGRFSPAPVLAPTAGAGE